MTTILIKKKDTAGAPAAGDLTNAAGGAEIAVNTATKRIYSKDSGGTVIEMGTYPSVMAVQGNLSATGTLGITGATNLNGAVTLGDASADNITVTGTITSNLLFTDATYDIGASGANRPRDLFLSRNLTVGGTLTLAGGVNLNGNVTIGDASSDTLTINSTITSNLIFTDNTYDIGASGATRPRNLYLSNSATIGSGGAVIGSTGNAAYTSAKGLVVDYTGSSTSLVVPIGFSWSSSTSTTSPYWGIGLIPLNFGSGSAALGFYVGGSEYGRFTSGGLSVTGTTTSSSRFIVSGSSNAGTSDISYGSYSGGVWVNAPTGQTSYLATAGTGVASWTSSGFTVNAGNLYVSGTGGRGVNLLGGGNGTVQIAGDGSTYSVGVGFYNNYASIVSAMTGVWAYGSGGVYQYMSLGGSAYNNGAVYIDSNKYVTVGAAPGTYTATRALQVANGLTLGYGLYTMADIGVTSNGSVTIAANSYPANVGSNTAVEIKAGSSGGGGPNSLAYFRSDGVTGLTNATPKTWSISPVIEGTYGAVSLGSSLGSSYTGNVYYNSGWKYRVASAATLYQQDSNGHHFSVAGSGSADAAVSFSTCLEMNTGNSAAAFGGSSLNGGYLRVYYGNSNRPVDIGGGNVRFNAEAGGWGIGTQIWGSSGTYRGYYGFSGSNDSLSAFNVQNENGTGVFMNSGSTAWSSTSDERVKNILGKVESGLSAVMAIDPIYFLYKNDDQTRNRRIGFSAQNVQPNMPEAVDEVVRDPENAPDVTSLSLAPTEMLPYIVVAIKELKAELDALKATIH